MEEGVLKFMVLSLALSVIAGAFWWWVLWRIAKLKPVAESNVARRAFKGLGLFMGIGTPVIAMVGVGLFLVL